jgi:hypothetical protein
MARRNGTVRRPGQEVVCGWCGGSFEIKARGRTPKWCSATCRQRAWEQRRAADSGLAAVEVVDRAIEHEKVVYVIEDSKPPTGRDWPEHIGALKRQVERGTFYDRDLPALALALNELLRALSRRRAWQHHRRHL